MNHDCKDCRSGIVRGLRVIDFELMKTLLRKVFGRLIFISVQARQRIVRNTFRQHRKVAQMADHSIRNGLLVQSYLNHSTVFPQLFSMTIYMSLVGFTLIHEGIMLIKQYKAGPAMLPVKYRLNYFSYKNYHWNRFSYSFRKLVLLNIRSISLSQRMPQH